ncbi:MAG: hypothetical protein WA840_24390 [Caulobacteraceae bacterium]
MDKDVLEKLRSLDNAKLASALDRMLEERPTERTALLKRFRTLAPDLYSAWLTYAASTGTSDHA